MKKFKRFFTIAFWKHLYLKIIKWDWNFILVTIISLELSFWTYIKLSHLSEIEIEPERSLELILTINVLFTAILVTYFFNNISQQWSLKKEHWEEAEKLSQKVTDFRRISDKLTSDFQVWRNDRATKHLLDQGRYGNVDYYDFKLSSFSDYESEDNHLIREIIDHEDYSEGPTDLYLGLISLVRDRKSPLFRIDHRLYGDYQHKGLYKLHFVERCVDIQYFGRLGFWLNNDYDFINYAALRTENRDEIINAICRINPKYIGRALDNSLLGDICNDMTEFYIKELHKHLRNLNQGIQGKTKLIFSILISCIVVGVISPFFTYFLIHDFQSQITITKILISLNFGLLIFFTLNLYRLIKNDLVWIE